MKTIVCIKQVPFIDQLRFDPVARRLVREGVGNEINPFDRRALSAAVELRQKHGGEVVALTMGPPQARDALAEALAVGCDRAVHLLGAEFAGADTLATARALAQACRRLGFDLILCGRYSTDAETAQVPPMLAELLDLPQVSAVTRLEIAPDAGRLTAVRELDDGFETLEAPLPAVLSASERLTKPIKVSPEALQAARDRAIEVWSASDLGGAVEGYGQAGSPTYVAAIHSLEVRRRGRLRRAESVSEVEAAVRETVGELLAEGLFDPGRGVSPPPVRSRSTPGASDQALWVVAETIDGRLRPVTFELLGRGLELAETLGGELAAVLLGQGIAPLADELAAYGAETVYLAEAPVLATYSVEPYTAILAQAIRRHDPYAVLLPSTADGRDLAPRLAARLGLGLTGDVIGLEIDAQGRLVQLKPAFGGTVVAPILTRTRPALATIRPGMLQAAGPDPARRPRLERLPATEAAPGRTRSLGFERNAGDGVGLDRAQVVIGVGMGLGGPEGMPPIRELAGVLGATVVGTRRVVDAGWLPRQVQVGLTGRSIAPRLYIAVGLSGKFNHTVGIQRAGTVLAINHDPQAEIFQACDFGLVGDWRALVPALTQALRAAHPG